MRKKLLVLFLATVSAVCLCMGLSACGEHTHTAGETVKENEVAATCTTDGSYYNVTYCSECGEVMYSQYVVVEATGHSWNIDEVTDATCTDRGEITYTCTNTGCTAIKTEYTSANGHTYTSEVIEEATCGHNGTIRYTCSVCGYTFDSTVKNTGISHTLTHVDAVAATETSDGNIEYWYCSVCGDLFTDSEGTTEVSPSYVLINALSHVHSLEYVAASAATCTEDGNTEYWYCTGCGKYFTDSIGTTETSLADVTIPASHTVINVAPKEATDNEDGNIEYWYCSVCGKYFSDSSVTNETTLANVTIAAGHYKHTLEKVEAVAATCTTDGNVEYWQCSVCNMTYLDDSATTLATSTDIVESATGHTYDSTNTCTVCGYLLENTLYYTLSSDGTSYTVSGIGSYQSYDVVIPATYNGLPVTAIARNAFYNNADITNVEISENITSIGVNAFTYCTSLTSIYIPDTVTYVGSQAFYGCTNLESATGFGGITSISSALFYECTSLVRFNSTVDGECIIPDNVTSIGEHAFQSCVLLTSVTMGSNVTSIGQCAFCYCESIESVVLSLSIDEITYGAFYGCTALESVTFVESATGSNLKTISNIAFSDCTSLKSIEIPASVEIITPNAFYGCTALESVTFIEDIITGSSLKTIDKQAFLGCTSLTSIYIPASVETIGYAAFYGCTSLVSVTGCQGLITIVDGAFNRCTSLKYFNSTIEGECIIPASVTSIGVFTFSYCSSLTSIVFEDSTGWYLTSTENGASEKTLDLSNSIDNVTYLVTEYKSYYWYKDTSNN